MAELETLFTLGRACIKLYKIGQNVRVALLKYSHSKLEFDCETKLLQRKDCFSFNRGVFKNRFEVAVPNHSSRYLTGISDGIQVLEYKTSVKSDKLVVSGKLPAHSSKIELEWIECGIEQASFIDISNTEEYKDVSNEEYISSEIIIALNGTITNADAKNITVKNLKVDGRYEIGKIPFRLLANFAPNFICTVHAAAADERRFDLQKQVDGAWCTLSEEELEKNYEFSCIPSYTQDSAHCYFSFKLKPFVLEKLQQPLHYKVLTNRTQHIFDEMAKATYNREGEYSKTKNFQRMQKRLNLPKKLLRGKYN
jgi:hypothetical protein